IMLSPVQTSEGMLAGRHQPLEPPTGEESLMPLKAPGGTGGGALGVPGRRGDPPRGAGKGSEDLQHYAKKSAMEVPGRPNLCIFPYNLRAKILRSGRLATCMR